MTEDNDDRLIRLEELAANQYQVIEDLSTQLAKQWKYIERLKTRIDEMTDRFEQLDDHSRAGEANQKPPHW